MNRFLVGIFLVVCASSAMVRSVESPTTAVENPHWSKKGCRICHGDSGEIAANPIDNSDELCLSCHNGQRARAELHPIGRTFAGPQTRRPDGWPTLEGKLACVTCHDVLLGCLHVEGQSIKDSRFLRGESPVGSTAFCTRCHVESAHEKWNPHRMSHNGFAWNEACRFCHTELMQAGDVLKRTGASKLRAPEPSLCIGCHTSHFDFFEPGHTGALVSDRMFDTIRSRIAAQEPPLNPISVLLPLRASQTVVCSTCHNPHESGVFSEKSPLSPGALNANGKSNHHGLRLPGNALCAACHGEALGELRRTK